MTDFDAKAREIVNADDWPDVQCTVGGAESAAMIIAAALKAAYTQGYSDCEQAIADTVRAKKVRAALAAARKQGFVLVESHAVNSAITELSEFARQQERSEMGSGIMYSMAISAIIKKLRAGPAIEDV